MANDLDKRASFRFKGKDSRDFYMYIENDISFPSPEQDIEFVEVLGRDGELVIDNQRLKGVDFPIPVTVKPPYRMKLETLSTQITEWLKSETGWFPLEFGTSPDYEYIAMLTNQYDIQNTIMNHGRTVLTFRLKPYKRQRNVQPVEMTKGTTLMNTHARPSKPLIHITGSGDITLTNNGKEWLKLRAVDGYITIDSELMTVYKGNRPAYDKVVDLGAFPLLSTAANEVSWTGNVTRLEILPRWESIT